MYLTHKLCIYGLLCIYIFWLFKMEKKKKKKKMKIKCGVSGVSELHTNYSMYIYKDGSVYLHFSEHPEKGSYHQTHFLCSQLSLQSCPDVQCANLSASVRLRDLLSMFPCWTGFTQSLSCAWVSHPCIDILYYSRFSSELREKAL